VCLLSVRGRCGRWSQYKIDHKKDRIGVFVSLVSTKIPFKVGFDIDGRFCCQLTSLFSLKNAHRMSHSFAYSSLTSA
jgi:hypothetical protein